MNGKAYNLKLTATEIEDKIDTRDAPYIAAKVSVKLNGEIRTRTLIAQGKARDAIKDVLIVGEEVAIRCLFSNATNDEGKKGGEYLTAIGLPRKAA